MAPMYIPRDHFPSSPRDSARKEGKREAITPSLHEANPLPSAPLRLSD